jgi:transmembrane sensor
MDKYTLIKKFLDNKCNSYEITLVMEYFENEPDIIDEFMNYSEWENLEVGSPSQDLKEKVWEGVKSSIHYRKSSIYIRLLKYAASLLLVLGGSILGYLYLNGEKNQNINSISNFSFFENKTFLNNTTPVEKQFELLDGTIVSLYPNSSLYYLDDFDRKRSIWLKGKANFNVAHNPENPFVVLAGNISVTALGTEFLVDETIQKIQVQLIEGKVVVKSLNLIPKFEDTYLTPGDQFVVDVLSNESALTKIGAEANIFYKPLGHKNHKLQDAIDLNFYKTSIDEVLSQLELRFDSKINYSESDLSEISFTGSLQEFNTLESSIRAIALSNGLDYKFDDKANQWTISRKSVGNSRLSNIRTENKGYLNNIQRMGDGFYFNKLALNDLFFFLTETYKVNIVVNNDIIKDKYFTGLISPNDDIEKLLDLITKMNELKLLKTPQGFEIIDNQ